MIRMACMALWLVAAEAGAGEGAPGPVPTAPDGADPIGTRLVAGDGYLEKEKFQEALIEYSQVLLEHPKHFEANLGRARALIGLGDGHKAAEAARLAAELRSDDPVPWRLLGDAFAHPGFQDFPRAADAYQRALKLTPDDVATSLRLARALSYQKKVPEAIRVLEQVRRHHPENVALLAKLAESYYSQRKLDLAEELLETGLKLDPDNPDLARVRGQIKGRRAYNFWVPIIAIIAFPLIYLFVRWLKRGRIPKV